jgi:hypothetical protein
VTIVNNIFNNFVKLYCKNKKGFGACFPLTYNTNKTIFCSRLDIYLNKDNQIAIDMKDSKSYYNVMNGYTTNAIGNLSDCFATSVTNLKLLDWFNCDYETPLYFNDFSLRLHLKNKITYNDTNSLTTQESFTGNTTIQKDFQTLINLIGSDKRLQDLTKKIK